ncbi:MAG: protein translocase subunit SecF [Pseudobdellovibrionaceae bacterium]
MKTLKLVPQETNVDFMRMRFIGYIVSALVIFGSFALLGVKGLNLGVDFTGGTLIEIQVQKAPNIPELRTHLDALDLGDISLQEFGAPNDLLLRLGQQPGGEDEQKAAIEKVRTSIDKFFADQTVDYRRVEYVGPQVGEELKRAGLLAFVLSMLGIMAYMWYRFEWQFGVGAVLALFHDSIGVLGYFALTGKAFDLSTLAAVMLVAGYSINDTVVVYDRIRENLRKFKKMPFKDLFNLSVNQMLSRSIMTSLTTVIVLVVLWLLGGEVIRSFAEALIFGIFLGTFSSIYVAAPILELLRLPRGSSRDDG